jgi:hypothetical protein
MNFGEPLAARERGWSKLCGLIGASGFPLDNALKVIRPRRESKTGWTSDQVLMKP